MAKARRNRSGEATAGGILHMAALIVRTEGADALTFDRLAERAGLSKGAVLYHFPSKDALLARLVEEYVQAVEGEIDRHRRQDGDRGAWIRGYLRACFPGAGGAAREANELSAALTAAAAANPPLLDAYRRRQPAWGAAMTADGSDPALTLLLRLALDGLWYNELLGIETAGPEERAALLRLVENLSRRGGDAPGSGGPGEDSGAVRAKIG
jgi:AcrR family transcriptional regulator